MLQVGPWSMPGMEWPPWPPWSMWEWSIVCGCGMRGGRWDVKEEVREEVRQRTDGRRASYLAHGAET